MVYVLSNDGKPLMPCQNVIARLLLKCNKAKVVKKCPFTIRLLGGSKEYTQKLTLGVDTGSSTIGTAVSDDKGNILYSSQVKVRNDIKRKMDQRRMYRRNRRSRKTRYRKPRFLNRKNSKRLNRFYPTMISKFHSHIKEIEFIKSILPISKLVFETATFDPHLLKNPCLANENYRHCGYQKGPNYGFENTKAAVLNRDNYTCQACNGKHKDSKLEVHHIIFKSKGGSDEHENLITLCHTCHYNLHHGIINPKFSGKTKGNLKHATHMNSIRIQLLKRFPDAVETFGFITKANRQLLNLPKDHHIDAAVIASEGRSVKYKQNFVFYKTSVSNGDYQQTKGIRSEKRIPTGKIKSFRKFDKVLYKGSQYFIKGRMSSGYAKLMDIDCVEQQFQNPKFPKMSNMIRLSARKTILCNQKCINLA